MERGEEGREELEGPWRSLGIPAGSGRPLGWLAPALSLRLRAEVPAVVTLVRADAVSVCYLSLCAADTADAWRALAVAELLPGNCSDF